MVCPRPSCNIQYIYIVWYLNSQFLCTYIANGRNNGYSNQILIILSRDRERKKTVLISIFNPFHVCRIHVFICSFHMIIIHFGSYVSLISLFSVFGSRIFNFQPMLTGWRAKKWNPEFLEVFCFPFCQHRLQVESACFGYHFFLFYSKYIEFINRR